MEEQNLKNWSLDKAHSSIEFSVRHMMISSVKGRFRDFNAEIKIDPENLEMADVKFTVNAASVDTDQPDRDTHLKSPDFFDVANFPLITFTTKSVVKSGNDLCVKGNLFIKGLAKEIAVKGEIQGPIKDPYGKQRIGFDGESTVNRKEFGLNWNMVLEGGGILVGDTVKLSIHLEAFTD